MEILHKEDEIKTGSHVDNGTSEGQSTAVEFDPWDPPYPMYVARVHKSYSGWCIQRKALVMKSRATNIIIPDRTPQLVNSTFYEIYPRLLPILEKDDVRRFLRLYAKYRDCMTSGFIIIPEAFNHMILQDALRCAEVALEGKAPELEGFRANPNCMNQYGYFPLHEAAERFSVDMIKLLLHHGALTSLRTAGTLVVEDLLPLHVAVEDTCLHKYLEDNLLPNQEHTNYPQKNDANYIYKIIYLLCLPELKMFLDTARLLAEYTNNVVDEICNYIKGGKVLQAAVLLLAAQAHIRVGSSCNGNGNNVDGFSTIRARIAEHIIAIQLESGQSEKEMLDLQAKRDQLSSAVLLVKIIAHAGKSLDSYIQTHQKVPQTEVLERVLQILSNHGFFPTGEGIPIGNLCPYKWRPIPDGDLPHKHGIVAGTEAAAGTPHLYPADKKVTRRKLGRRRERQYTWNNFFPYWRSALEWRNPVKENPAYACNSGSKSFGTLSMPVPNGNAVSLTRTPQVTSMNRSSRLFGTVALAILKVLKNA